LHCKRKCILQREKSRQKTCDLQIAPLARKKRKLGEKVPMGPERKGKKHHRNRGLLMGAAWKDKKG